MSYLKYNDQFIYSGNFLEENIDRFHWDFFKWKINRFQYKAIYKIRFNKLLNFHTLILNVV